MGQGFGVGDAGQGRGSEAVPLPRPDLVDMEALRRCNAHYNLQSAFNLAERELGLTKLLDPEGERGPGGSWGVPWGPGGAVGSWGRPTQPPAPRCQRGPAGREVHHHLRGHLLPLLLQDEGAGRGGEAHWEGGRRGAPASLRGVLDPQPHGEPPPVLCGGLCGSMRCHSPTGAGWCPTGCTPNLARFLGGLQDAPLHHAWFLEGLQDAPLHHVWLLEGHRCIIAPRTIASGLQDASLQHSWLLKGLRDAPPNCAWLLGGVAKCTPAPQVCFF